MMSRGSSSPKLDCAILILSRKDKYEYLSFVITIGHPLLCLCTSIHEGYADSNSGV